MLPSGEVTFHIAGVIPFVFVSSVTADELSETLLSGAEVAEAVLLASPVVVVSAVVSAVVVVTAFELLSVWGAFQKRQLFFSLRCAFPQRDKAGQPQGLSYQIRQVLKPFSFPHWSLARAFRSIIMPTFARAFDISSALKG